MGTPAGDLFRQQFPTSADVFGSSDLNFFDMSLINYKPSSSSFCSPSENCESPVSVLRYPPTPISAIECRRTSNELAPLPPLVEYCEDPPFRFSGQWVDLDREMQLWRNKLTQPPIAAANFSKSSNYTTDEQFDSSNQNIPERSALDSSEKDSVAESHAKRKGVDVGCASELFSAFTFVVKGSQKKLPKKPRITKTRISRIDLELQFGKTRKEAASCLDVSVATLKRTARLCGIPRWPFNKKSKGHLNASANLVVGPVSTQPETAIEKISKSDQTAPIPPKQLATDTVMEDERSMTVKVKYKADFIKFELSSLSKMADLEEEISKRLKLMVGSFKIKYLDEDGDWVLLPCDADLEYCMRSLVKTTIKMFVLPITT